MTIHRSGLEHVAYALSRAYASKIAWSWGESNHFPSDAVVPALRLESLLHRPEHADIDNRALPSLVAAECPYAVPRQSARSAAASGCRRWRARCSALTCRLSSSPDAGIPLSDVALAAALAAGLAAFPRALLGAALGLLTVVIAIRERPAWDRWRDGMNIVWWFSILGLAAYGRSWGLDFVVRCLKTLVAAARSTVRSLGASWSLGAAARRHPTHWMARHSVGLWAWRGLEPRARRY